MMPSPVSVLPAAASLRAGVLVEKAEQLESFIESLERQRSALQGVESWGRGHDFGDFIEAVGLLELHIGMNQKELREVRAELGAVMAALA